MTLSLHILPAAEQDLSEIGDYFDERSNTLSQRFYARFWDTVQTLAEAPGLGGLCQFRHPENEGMRIWQVNGFPNHLIFYRSKGDMLEIIRVIHGARDYATMFNEE